jgi:hypothetical protein
LKVRSLFFILFLNVINVCFAQRSPFVFVQTGATFYQGDLAPKPLDFSFGEGNLSYGFGVGVDLFKWLDLSLSYNKGTLSGDDKFADNEARRKRNLSFFTPLHHIGMNTSLNINHFVKSLDKYNLSWYIGAGIGYNFFDPHARYKGHDIRLQPLGTEGQNLSTHPTGPYRLSTLVNQLGGSVFFNVNKKVSLGLEAWTTRAGTDYLDDVSTVYPDLDYMKENQQWLSYYMADRSTELQSSTSSAQEGEMRGNPSKNDRYVRVGLICKYHFSGKLSQDQEKAISE